MTRVEFEALLRLQDRRLIMCDVSIVEHKTQIKMYAADVMTKEGHIVMDGPRAKTPAAAVQRAIARYYKS